MTTISQRTEFTTEPAHPLTDFIETVLSWYIGLMSDRSTVATKYVVVLRGWGNLMLGNCKIKDFK